MVVRLKPNLNRVLAVWNDHVRFKRDHKRLKNNNLITLICDTLCTKFRFQVLIQWSMSPNCWRKVQMRLCQEFGATSFTNNIEYGPAKDNHFHSFVFHKIRSSPIFEIRNKIETTEKYCVKIKFLLSHNTRFDSNFNWICDYDYKTQGLNIAPNFTRKVVNTTRIFTHLLHFMLHVMQK